ncbi:MAG: type IV secretion system protein [Synergistaceae bacterium]|nr:type IV secretion system protein [Synergistaceae bacterium]
MVMKTETLWGVAPSPIRGRGPLNPIWKMLVLGLIFISIFVFFVGGAQAGEEVAAFTDSMLQNFQERFAAYEDRIWQAALSLFGLLFLCQFTWSVAQLCLHESFTFAGVITVVIRQVMTGMFFYWLLFDRSILRGIVGSFSQLAQSGLRLSDLIFLMESAVLNIMTAVGKSSGVIEGIALFFTGLAASVVMSFALTTAIAYMAVVMLENYIVASLGLILMGFGGSEYTRNYALSYIRTLVHIGIKLFLSTIIVQIGVMAFTRATMGLNSMDTESISQACMRLIAQSFFFLAIVKVIPEIANSLVSGTSTTGAHTVSAVRGAGIAAGMAAGGLVMGAYNAPSKAADSFQRGKQSVERAANAYSSKYEASRSKGHGSFAAGVSALGGMAWEAYREGRSQAASTGSQSVWRNMVSASTSEMPPETQPAGQPLTQNQPRDANFGNS